MRISGEDKLKVATVVKDKKLKNCKVYIKISEIGVF